MSQRATAAELDRKFQWLAMYLDSQHDRRRAERSKGWPLVGILRKREVVEIPVADGVMRVTREVIGLR